MNRAIVVERLSSLGLTLPVPAQPLGAYRAATLRGAFGALSGQFALVDGRPLFPGVVGDTVALDDAIAASRAAAVNVVAQIAAATDDFSTFGGLYRLDGFVRSEPGFTDHAKVLDGASELLVHVFGADLGGHARTAVGVASLPMNASVELGVTFAVIPKDLPRL